MREQLRALILHAHRAVACIITSSRWKGLPESVARSGLGALQREKHDRERSLDKKKDQLAELLVQQIAFRNLARRNRFRAGARAANATAADAGGGGEDGAGEQDAEDVAASKVNSATTVILFHKRRGSGKV